MLPDIVKIPTLVDVHVHFREPGATHKEDFETGTMAAVAGGYSQVLDMPNNNPSTVNLRNLQRKIRLTKDRIWCDVGFNFGATKDSAKIFDSVKTKVFGLKVYMSQTTGPLLVTGDEERDLIFKNWQSELPIMIHAKDGLIEVALRLAKKYQRSLHICHVTANQLKAISRARKEGLKISCEVTPHHLFLNLDDAKKLGPFGMMKPPLLTKKDQIKLWDNLDKIDMISTDHAPHTVREKQDQKSPKFGVPGLETTVPLFFQAIKEGKITIGRFIKMTSTNPRRIFKLPEQKNSHVLIETKRDLRISNRNLFTKSKWTPFDGMVGGGQVIEVVIRGKTIFKRGKFIGEPSGKIIYPISN